VQRDETLGARLLGTLAPVRELRHGAGGRRIVHRTLARERREPLTGARFRSKLNREWQKGGRDSVSAENCRLLSRVVDTGRNRYVVC
jgi:hypothetical protein